VVEMMTGMMTGMDYRSEPLDNQQLIKP